MDELDVAHRWYRYLRRAISASTLERYDRYDDIVRALQRWSKDKRDGLIDLRRPKDFAEWHVRGSSSFPVETLRARRPLLPPRGARVALLGKTKDVDEAVAYLSKDYDLRWAILDEGQIAGAATACGVVETADRSAELWSPSPLLRRALPMIESMMMTTTTLNCTDSERKMLVDIGSGSGRDLIFSARRGWYVDAGRPRTFPSLSLSLVSL